MSKSLYETNLPDGGERGEREEHGSGDSAGRRERARPIVAAVVVVFALVEIAQNGERVKLNVLFWSWHTGLWIALAAAWGLGLLAGLVLPALIRRRRRDSA